MVYLLVVFCLVTVCGRAVSVSRAHIHVTGMFARAVAIGCHTTGPALAVAGCRTIRELQGFVFKVGVGVGREGPDFADLVLHVSGCLFHSHRLTLVEVVLLPEQAGLAGRIFKEDFALVGLHLPCLLGIVEFNRRGPGDCQKPDLIQVDGFGVKEGGQWGRI